MRNNAELNTWPLGWLFSTSEDFILFMCTMIHTYCINSVLWTSFILKFWQRSGLFFFLISKSIDIVSLHIKPTFKNSEAFVQLLRDKRGIWHKWVAITKLTWKYCLQQNYITNFDFSNENNALSYHTRYKYYTKSRIFGAIFSLPG